MSFFKKLFGGRSFAELRDEADRAFDAGEFAEARLAYERALDAAGDASASDRERCAVRMDECLDALAKLRIEEADRLIEDGHFDLAEAELTNALELAKDESIVKLARRRVETMEKEDARRMAEAPDELSDDDRWAILAGNWEPEQLDEYDEYGDELRDALLAMHDGEIETAREALEALLEETESPVYLWLEVGRARMSAEAFEEAEEAFREFLEALEDGEGGQARLAAHNNLALLRDHAGDEEGAIAELSQAMESFEDQPGPYLFMGQYLLSKGHAAEAVDVLEAGMNLLDEERPDWRYLEQTGLAYVAADDPENAAAVFDRVIAFFVSLRGPDRPLEYPPATAVARAKIYEDEGRLDRAADLYRTLSSGSDVENHLTYHEEAARLLLELELPDDARRMLTRALALAEGDEEKTASIEARLADLE
ncbi:MAG: tetratricopeptide repeat protein [Sandaracinaceae bacterium]